MPRTAKATIPSIPVTFRMSGRNKAALILVATHTGRNLGDVLNDVLWTHVLKEHPTLAEQARSTWAGPMTANG